LVKNYINFPNTHFVSGICNSFELLLRHTLVKHNSIQLLFHSKTPSIGKDAKATLHLWV